MSAPPQMPVLSNQDQLFTRSCSRERLLVVLCFKQDHVSVEHTPAYFGMLTHFDSACV